MILGTVYCYCRLPVELNRPSDWSCLQSDAWHVMLSVKVLAQKQLYSTNAKPTRHIIPAIQSSIFRMTLDCRVCIPLGANIPEEVSSRSIIRKIICSLVRSCLLEATGDPYRPLPPPCFLIPTSFPRTKIEFSNWIFRPLRSRKLSLLGEPPRFFDYRSWPPCDPNIHSSDNISSCCWSSRSFSCFFGSGCIYLAESAACEPSRVTFSN